MHKVGLTVAAALAVTAASGCIFEPNVSKKGESKNVEDEGNVDLGEVQLALAGQAASGNYYILRNAILVVQGPSTTEFFDTESDPFSTTITSSVPAGDYSVFLQEGWRLDRYDTQGNLTEGVGAFMTSGNPQFFGVAPGALTQVALTFRAGDDVIGMGTYEIRVDVEESGGVLQPTYCQSDAECASGQTCCSGGFLGTCVALEPGAGCPLPDLTVSEEAARNSLFIRHEVFPEDSCSLVEGCVGAPGDRRLLTFSTETPNVGEADMILGMPSEELGFEFSACHGHYHFEGYAAYQLQDAQGSVVATGHKQAFCLLDSSPVTPGAPSNPRYHCGFQGIQAGWSDVYGSGLDCQWVDITDVPPGDYRLTITINHEHTLPESNYDNNSVSVAVTIPEDVPPVPGDPLSPCAPGEGGLERDCGLQAATGFENVACTPGESIQVGCGCDLGACSGDPVLRVCDGAEACTAASALSMVDDTLTCGFCPATTFTCPASGSYSVLVGAFQAGTPFVCDVSQGG